MKTYDIIDNLAEIACNMINIFRMIGHLNDDDISSQLMISPAAKMCREMYKALPDRCHTDEMDSLMCDFYFHVHVGKADGEDEDHRKLQAVASMETEASKFHSFASELYCEMSGVMRKFELSANNQS